ncbi:uncharacterized protein Z518_01112 [Rhinocladiella mackenziei CBS 650.93]|uniref:Zn(2)-C6 fungal-type domain-containing protein n=1 Tax=Rhinocladiella mackenziei CBS 650.93 TaxID=1442369 RepID=A0A0D2J316_9EURO|nr:uncharacterized protein Z518_01112 [Rhinocladiella mackenziei CBS 650.93]KIX10031.1 hypothetical protein Z518_01112 [Rhinocladiella mackenziei CBS 650.93]
MRPKSVPMQRRPHKKSRNGCYSCKSRRIKCGEEKPQCENCIDLKRECMYPSSQISMPKPEIALSTHYFSLRDLQYFHHFLQAAVPHLPLGSGKMWNEDIPRLAYHRPYLMHALLGLGAFHLGAMSLEQESCHREALDHRIYAIQGLNSAMSESSQESNESGAILAACYALTFQSVYLADGMIDFIVFVRGCYLAANTFRGGGLITGLPNRHLDIVAPELARMPKANVSELQRGLTGLEQISSLLKTPPELKFYHGIKGVLTGLMESSRLGYTRFISLYDMWTTQENLEALINPHNAIMQLMLFFYLLESIMLAPFTPWDFPEASLNGDIQTKSYCQYDPEPKVRNHLPHSSNGGISATKIGMNAMTLVASSLDPAASPYRAMRIVFNTAANANFAPKSNLFDKVLHYQDRSNMKCDLVAAREDDSIAWVYCPSFGAAVLFAVLFGLSTILHIIQAVNFRKKFCWVIIMAGLWETAGFAVRSYSAKQFRGLGHFIPQQLLIILAPLWVNAFVYMVAGRMIYFLIPEKKVFGISAHRLTLIFVILDIFAFLVQGSSSSLMTSDDYDTIRIGIDIYMAGVGVQELFIVLFTILAARFQWHMNQIERVHPVRHRWRSLLYPLYVALGLITVRIIFRLVEYTDGEYSYVARYEAFFYCLEALPMVVSLAMFNVWHPAMVLVGPESEFPKRVKKSRAEKKMEKEKEKAQKNSRKGKARGRVDGLGAAGDADGIEMRI